MRINTSYSFGHDVGNYFNSIYKYIWMKHGRREVQKELLKPLPENFKKALRAAQSETEAKEVIKKYLLDNIDKRKALYSKKAEDLQNSWVKNGRQIEKDLEKLYGGKVPFKEVEIYLTSLPISPYKYPEWILIYAEMPVKRQLEVLKHELNHFMFYFYCNQLEEKIGKEKFEFLKEALTVFSNPEEKGYPAQRKLRTWLLKQKGTIPEILKGGDWRKFL